MLATLKALFQATSPNTLAGAQAALVDMPAIKIAQLRKLVLWPVMLVIFVTAATLIAAVYLHGSEDIDRTVHQLQTSANAVYQDYQGRSFGMLAGITDTISRDTALRRALEKNDREKLSKLVEASFVKLQKQHGITHLYFIGADQKVILRAHNPEQFGDVIERVTVLDAKRTREPAHGVELGPDGNLVLRFVKPVYTDIAKQHLIGFIETGVDTGHLLAEIQKSLGVQLFQFISKEFLKRETWQQSNPGQSAGWDSFPDVAPSEYALKTMTPEMSAIMLGKIFPAANSLMNVSQGEFEYRAISSPMFDLENRKAGSFVLLADVTSKIRDARNTLLLGLGLGTAGGGLLFVFFWLLTGRMGRLIERHQDALRHLATRDGLTGLYNHVTFYTLLEDEIARAGRSGAPVSLLMIDLDHFRNISDKYGQLTGDKILKECGRILYRQLRAIDKVCRYSNEELAIILPNTDSAGAAIAAEHMRAAIEGLMFASPEGQQISLTISAGVAACPAHAKTAHELVTCAEQAMHVAQDQGRNRVHQYNS